MIRRAILKAVGSPVIRYLLAGARCRCRTAGNWWYPAYRQRDWRKRRVEGDDQGADDTTNAVSIRNFFKRGPG